MLTQRCTSLFLTLPPLFSLATPETTIALAIVHQLIGLIPDETVQQLLIVILEALNEEDFDYWGEVKDEVMALVGQYINEHNMNQVKVYQKDLATLIDRSAAANIINHNCIVISFHTVFTSTLW